MLFRLMLLLTIIPLLEVYFLLRLSDNIGGFNTFAVVIFTGMAGAWLLRQQGASILADLQKQATQNQIPAKALTRGLFTFIGGILLLTPGILTDALGFSLIFPLTQKLWQNLFKKNWQKGVASGNIHTYSNVPFSRSQKNPFEPLENRPLDNDVIEVEAKSTTTVKKN